MEISPGDLRKLVETTSAAAVASSRSESWRKSWARNALWVLFIPSVIGVAAGAWVLTFGPHDTAISCTTVTHTEERVDTSVDTTCPPPRLPDWFGPLSLALLAPAPVLEIVMRRSGAVSLSALGASLSLGDEVVDYKDVLESIGELETKTTRAPWWRR